MMTQYQTRKLFIIFAALYFVQGTGELTAGLLAQPLRSMLRNWGYDSAGIATFMFLLGFPWYIKPVFGLLTDFIPIKGLRRKSYLILSSSLMIVGFLCATLLPLTPAAATAILLVLLLPSFGIAFKDVATDATMIETGQPLGITGRLQSAQWGAMYGAGLICGVAGGWISQHGQQRLGFLAGAILGLVALYIAIFHIKEKPRPELQRGQLKRAIKVLGEAVRTRIVLLVAAFIFLLSFNPFSADVLYMHMSEQLGFSEQFIGYTYTISSLGSILACILYGLFAKKVPLRILLHGSVVFMVLSSLVYIGLGTKTSAVIISLAYGFFYMVTGLAQLELAGRYCPPAAAGTVFALLMSLWNLGIALSSILGGRFYEAWKLSYGPDTAYSLLVVVGAGFTAVCWFLVLFFPKTREE
ncbi:MAG: folate/biopterin family MFS transporter [candidate division Zixibacteria bacterium]|nr:folate/biopterin family MFS transporter [candidate division Zixibacteria bacterium]